MMLICKYLHIVHIFPKNTIITGTTILRLSSPKNEKEQHKFILLHVFAHVFLFHGIIFNCYWTKCMSLIKQLNLSHWTIILHKKIQYLGSTNKIHVCMCNLLNSVIHLLFQFKGLFIWLIRRVWLYFYIYVMVLNIVIIHMPIISVIS